MPLCRVTADPEEAAAALRAGKLVAIPTETVYGLAGNAFNPHVAARIFEAKHRPTFDPLIVHLPSAARLSQVAAEVSPLARKLGDAFWPGPLTLVFPKTAAVPDLVTSGLSTVAVRIPDHPLARRLLELIDFPLAAPSANLFGRLSPTMPEHVLEQLGDRIDLVLDGGPCRVGLESTIVFEDQQAVRLLRPGGISLEAIAQVCGSVPVLANQGTSFPLAPGQLPSHYAPSVPLTLLDTLPTSAPHDRTGALAFTSENLKGYALVEVLSVRGDLAEAAANFFPALHRLERSGVQSILAQTLPEVGLGRALNDRLRRAAFRAP